jgi:hypothetical protein
MASPSQSDENKNKYVVPCWKGLTQSNLATKVTNRVNDSPNWLWEGVEQVSQCQKSQVHSIWGHLAGGAI